MSGLAWVLGRGGLLGSHLEAALRRADWTPFVPRLPSFHWEDTRVLTAELDTAIAAFLAEARRDRRPFVIAWAAGAGVVGTPPEALAREVEAWRAFLRALARRLSDAPAPPGQLFFSSSAGGVHGAHAGGFIGEDAPLRPASPYGEQKISQEALLRETAPRLRGVRCLIGRISNLYGPGQDLRKRQGLISQISRHVLHRRPVHIYVGLDTLRDYLFAAEAAERIVLALGRHLREGPAEPRVKLIASEDSVSIAAILGCFRQLSRTPVRVVSFQDARRSLQPSALVFRSHVWADLAPHRVPLFLGIHALHEHQARLYREGRLPAPS